MALTSIHSGKWGLAPEAHHTRLFCRDAGFRIKMEKRMIQNIGIIRTKMHHKVAQKMAHFLLCLSDGTTWGKGGSVNRVLTG